MFVDFAEIVRGALAGIAQCCLPTEVDYHLTSCYFVGLAVAQAVVSVRQGDSSSVAVIALL